MVDVQGQAVVAVLTRAPSAGGKSRLFATLGRPPDSGLLSALLLDTLDGVRVPGVTRVVVVEPGDACGDVQRLVPGDVRVIAQSIGTLGDRMRAAMGALFAAGASIVVVIGSDLPDITPDRITAAVALVSDAPACLALGPAEDGGYYLIAASRVPDVFDGIEWGTPHVLEQTRASAERAGLRVRLVEPMRDVDTPDDLRRVAAPRTRAWVEAMAPSTG